MVLKSTLQKKVKLMYIVRKLEMFLGKKAKIKYLPCSQEIYLRLILAHLYYLNIVVIKVKLL